MADYEVGYKKPPRHSRFKLGNRVNPHGRGKRKQRMEAEIVHEVMNSSVEYREGGKSKRATRIELVIKCYGAAALRGDVKAAEALLTLRAHFEKHPDIEPIAMRLNLNPADAAIL